jgi:hypothetical protein
LGEAPNPFFFCISKSFWFIRAGGKKALGENEAVEKIKKRGCGAVGEKEKEV